MSELAIRDNAPLVRWTDDEKRLIHDLYAKGTTESEFKLFLYTAAKYGLDPLVKEVWCVKYGNNPASIFTGRDGFLAIAHRSGKLGGLQSGVRKEGTELVGWCKVTRTDWAEPFIAEVYQSEYATGSNPLWRSKPRTMLVKVAESQALRKAFDIHGLYLPEEIDPQDRPAPQVVTAVKVVSATSEHTEAETVVDAQFTPAATEDKPYVKPDFTAFWRATKDLGYTQVDVLTHVPDGDIGAMDQGELDELLDMLREEKGQ